MIASVNKNKGSLKEEMILDSSRPNESIENITKQFNSSIDASLKAWMTKNPGKTATEAPWNKIL